MRDAYASGAALVSSGEALREPPPIARGSTRGPARPSAMDRSCALALVAVERALADAHVDAARWRSERIAVQLGSAFGCHATNEAFYRGLLVEGPRAASPRLFAYTLPSSPLGELTIRLRARGPVEAHLSGRHAGIEALVHAARLCDAGEADLAIAVAVEVGGGLLPALGYRVRDSAAAILVESSAALARRGGRARARLLGGAGAFASGRADEAAAAAGRLALADAGVTDGEPLASIESRSAADDGAVAAVEALGNWLAARPPAVGRALLCAGDREGGAAALLVEGLG
jgi:3-oxoacyl-[acyl-carrier-protein] synthase II